MDLESVGDISVHYNVLSLFLFFLIFTIRFDVIFSQQPAGGRVESIYSAVVGIQTVTAFSSR